MFETPRLAASAEVSDRIQASSQRDPDPYDWDDFYGGQVPHLAGVRLNVDEALQLAVVWACIEAIAGALAPSPWLVRELDTRGRYRTLYDSKVYYRLNVRPNADMTAVSFREALIFNALTHGNAYAEIQRDGGNNIAALHPLDPTRVKEKRRSNDALYYEHTEEGGRVVQLNPLDVFHLRGASLNGLVGDNLVARAAKAMSLAAAEERFASSYFGNNTHLGGVIEYPGKLGEANAESMLRTWNAAHRGPDKAHKPQVLEQGAKYVQFSATAESSQLIESRKFSIEQICRFYGVPPHKIGHLDRATFNNIEWLGIDWVRGLTKWASRLEQEANAKLFSERSGRITQLDLKWLMHGDAQSRAAYYTSLRNLGVLSINEIREAEGMNDIGPEGDVRIMPLAMQTLEQLALSVEAQRQQLNAGADTRSDAGESDDAPPTSPNEPAEPVQIPNPTAAARVRQSLTSLFASVLETCAARSGDLVPRPFVLDAAADVLGMVDRLRGAPLDLSTDLIGAVEAVERGESVEANAALIVSKALAVRRVA